MPTGTRENERSQNAEADDAPPASAWPRWDMISRENKGVLLLLISEVFGSSMDAIARFIQQGGGRMHSFQIIFARMGITFVLSSLYMWWAKVPDFPLGKPSVRGWLVLRAVFGFCGLFCLYYSVHYLPLAEATVFRFLVPIITAWACSVFLTEVFTKKELAAGLVALTGVVIIAHPSFIFGDVNDKIGSSAANDVDDVAPTQRLFAIAVSLLGVFGAAGAYTTIRVIGDRAHALMSVNYFSFLSTIVSAFALLVIPGISFTMPKDAQQWTLLILLGVLGFALQFLLTSALQLDRSSKVTSMMYTQVLFALAFDWGIWGVIPGGWSLFGGAIVIASTLWSALQKTQKPAKAAPKTYDEESALLGSQAEGVEEALYRSTSR